MENTKTHGRVQLCLASRETTRRNNLLCFSLLNVLFLSWVLLIHFFISAELLLSPCSMTPREHMRKMSMLGEQGALEEKQLYRLAGGMAAGGEHRGTHCTAGTYSLQETASSRFGVFERGFKFILGVTAETFCFR